MQSMYSDVQHQVTLFYLLLTVAAGVAASFALANNLSIVARREGFCSQSACLQQDGVHSISCSFYVLHAHLQACWRTHTLVHLRCYCQ